MKYTDFFKEDRLPGGKGDTLPPQNVDPKELAMGIKVETEHTGDEALASEIARDHLSEDPHYYSKLQGAGLADELPRVQGPNNQPVLDVPSRIGVVAIGKVVSNGNAFAPARPVEPAGGVSSPNDKEPITAAGKIDASSAAKSVGGTVAPGEGQKQGGPNTQGKISDTPTSSEIESGQSESKGGNLTGGIDKTPKNSTIGESTLKDVIKEEIRSVIKEMWLGWGNEKSEDEPIGDDDEDIEASDPESPEFDPKRFGGPGRQPADYKESTLESAPPGFPQDLEAKIKNQYGADSPKAYATMWKIHNKGWVDEVRKRLPQ